VAGSQAERLQATPSTRALPSKRMAGLARLAVRAYIYLAAHTPVLPLSIRPSIEPPPNDRLTFRPGELSSTRCLSSEIAEQWLMELSIPIQN